MLSSPHEISSSPLVSSNDTHGKNESDEKFLLLYLSAVTKLRLNVSNLKGMHTIIYFFGSGKSMYFSSRCKGLLVLLVSSQEQLADISGRSVRTFTTSHISSMLGRHIRAYFAIDTDLPHQRAYSWTQFRSIHIHIVKFRTLKLKQ